MMERMEKENAGSERTDGDAGRSDASQAAGQAAARRVELGDAWTPTGERRQRRAETGGARTSWVPAAFAAGVRGARPSARARRVDGRSDGGSSFGFEPTSVVRAVEPTRTRPATKPSTSWRCEESLCEIQRRRRSHERGALASLFAREARNDWKNESGHGGIRRDETRRPGRVDDDEGESGGGGA